MAKRKRASVSASPEPSASSEPTSRAVKRLKRACNTRLVSAKKSLVPALRLGSAFERQKHTRRKKAAQSNSDSKASARLDAENLALKELDLEKVADQHLRKTVGRVKSLREQEALKDYVAGVEKGSAEPAVLNVLARLYNVPAVKAVVDEMVDDLKELVAASEAHTEDEIAEKTPKKARKGSHEDEDMPDVSDDEDDAFAAFNARIAAPSSGEEDSDGSMSDDDRPPSIGDSDSDHDPDADLEAHSSSEEADTFADVGSDDDEAIDGRTAPPSDYSVSSPEPDDPSLAPTKAEAKPAKAAHTNSSTFFPTLSAAYLPGDDSEASDLDDDKPRKNRRGQRARQKIAEQKHGAKAKHLEKQERNTGWDAKRGAVSDNRRNKPASRGPVMSGENALPLGGAAKKEKVVNPKERDDKGELHPSWQAAKLAKEKKMIKIEVGNKAVAGMGKKVVFD
jgi:hypothetical protein